MDSGRGSRGNYGSGRVLSLSDIIYHTEGENDAPGAPEREDFYYDDELELDYETSIPAEGGRDADSDVLPGNINLRFHGRGDLNLNLESERLISSCGFPVSSCDNNKVLYKVCF